MPRSSPSFVLGVATVPSIKKWMRDNVRSCTRKALDALLDELCCLLFFNYKHMKRQNRIDKLSAFSGPSVYFNGAIVISKRAMELFGRLTSKADSTCAKGSISFSYLNGIYDLPKQYYIR